MTNQYFVDAVCSTIGEDGTYSKSKILRNETEYMILDSGNFCEYGENVLILDA